VIVEWGVSGPEVIECFDICNLFISVMPKPSCISHRVFSLTQALKTNVLAQQYMLQFTLSGEEARLNNSTIGYI